MTHEWVDTFLETLAQNPNVSAAASAAGISRQAAYDYKHQNPEFDAAWEDALDQSTDGLVGECYRRAKDGVTKPVFQGGEHVGNIQEYSDTLAIFLLKAHRRAVYGDKQQIDLTGLSDNELLRRASADPAIQRAVSAASGNRATGTDNPTGSG